MNLKEFLETAPIETSPLDKEYKIRPAIITGSGVVVSVQQSARHYSGENTVEVMFTNADDAPVNFESESGSPNSNGLYGWVTMEKAQGMLDSLGGIKELEIIE